MTVKTAAQALAFVRKHRVVTLAARIERVPCFVEAVIGERITGSWWGHPKGKLIYALAEGLEDSRQLVSVKLLDGKATFVDRALWPGLLTVVLDEAWRSGREKALSKAARALWRKVEASSRRGEAAAATKELEEALVVHSASEHTEKGRHEKRLTGWAQWAQQHKVRPAKVAVEEALSALRSACGGRPTSLDD